MSKNDKDLFDAGAGPVEDNDALSTSGAHLAIDIETYSKMIPPLEIEDEETVALLSSIYSLMEACVDSPSDNQRSSDTVVDSIRTSDG